MAAPATCVMTAPADGAVIEIASGESSIAVHVTGTTDASAAVQILNDGTPIGSAGAANGSGAFDITLTLTPGVYELTARAGTNPEFTISDPAHTISVRPTIRTAATVTWYFNWLNDSIVSGIPQYTAKRAACLWAGVAVDKSMAAALNEILGNAPGLWVSVNQALNEIAETSGLGNANALKVICEGEVS